VSYLDQLETEISEGPTLGTAKTAKRVDESENALPLGTAKTAKSPFGSKDSCQGRPVSEIQTGETKAVVRAKVWRIWTDGWEIDFISGTPMSRQQVEAEYPDATDMEPRKIQKLGQRIES
jgi:hypothetical protein